MQDEPITLEKVIETHRDTIETTVRGLVSLAKELKSATTAFTAGEKEDRGEVIANVMLALRHAEDAKMRLGKVYQAMNGGVSNNTR